MPVWRASLRPQVRADAYEHLLVPHVPESIGQLLPGLYRCSARRLRLDPRATRYLPLVGSLTYRRVAVDRISVTVGSLDQPYDFPSEVQYGVENRPHFADGITQGEGTTSAQSTARAPGNYATRQHPDHDTDEWPPTSVVAESALVRTSKL
jgi:hypothetical protein